MARKSIILTTRLLPEEKAEAARRAADAGLSLNAFVVRAISGEERPPLFLTDGEDAVQLIPEREALGEVIGSAMDRLSVEAVGAEVVESDHPDMRDATLVVDGIVSKRYVSLRPPFEALAPAERYGRLLSVREAMFALTPVMDDIPWKDGELPRFTVRTPLQSVFATVEDGTAHPASVEVVGATDDDDAQWMLDQAEREADRSFPVLMPPVIAKPKGPLVLEPGAVNVFDPVTGEPSTLATFGCGHAKTPENARKIGKGRVGCKECRKAVDRRHAEAKAKS